jgi:phage baseplate assembly protein W
LVFEPIDDTTAAMAKARITQAMNRWLGHRVTLEYVEVRTKNSTIEVDVRYRLAGTEDSRVLRFQRDGG